MLFLHHMQLEDHLDKLRAFQAVVQSGTVREAATRLNMTQPALTRLIQVLEQAAGAPLFHRSRTGMTVTRAGIVLAEYADITLKNLADTEARLKNPGDGEAGLLRVGSFESLAEYLWPDFVTRFRKTAPLLRLLIKTSAASGHQAALRKGLLDAVVDAEPRMRDDLTSWRLYEDRFAFFASPSAGLENIVPANARGIALLYCPAAFDSENRHLLQHLEEKNYDFTEKMEFDSFTAVKTFAEAAWDWRFCPYVSLKAR